MTMDVEASQLSCGLLSSLNFEKIDTEILADKVKEQEETKADIVEKDAIGKEISRGKDADESTAPPSQYMHTLYFFYIIQKNWLPPCFGVLAFLSAHIFWRTMVAPWFWGFRLLIFLLCCLLVLRLLFRQTFHYQLLVLLMLQFEFAYS